MRAAALRRARQQPHSLMNRDRTGAAQTPHATEGAAGFVLAGGRSRRMGTNKALLPYRSATLVESIAAEVRAAAGSVAIVGPPGVYAPLGIHTIADLKPGLGPMGGVVTALTATTASLSLIVACDLAGISEPFLTALLEAARARPERDCIAAAGPGGPEPLCAVWRASALAQLVCALDAGRLKMKEALAGMDTALWTPPGPLPFRNVNTPADWQP